MIQQDNSTKTYLGGMAKEAKSIERTSRQEQIEGSLYDLREAVERCDHRRRQRGHKERPALREVGRKPGEEDRRTMSKPTFILIGAAGYVAPRHMEAIKAVGGELIAAVDPHDSVGVLDQYFPKCQFFKDHLDAFDKVKADYVVICTPNNTHGVMAWHALEAGMNVILEKPATITAGRVKELQEIEKANGKRVLCILQMRLHPAAREMRIAQANDTWRVVNIEYHTPRGPWYFESWKANKLKSGGILFNIGIHLFDLAIDAFGVPSTTEKADIEIDDHHALGNLDFPRASVGFNLSINGHKRERIFYVDGEPYDFTKGFEDLHIQSYQRILAGKGFTLEDAAPAIELCERLSNAS